MEIDYDYLRTGTAIGFRAFRELFSNYLLSAVFPSGHVKRRAYLFFAIHLSCLKLFKFSVDWLKSVLDPSRRESGKRKRRFKSTGFSPQSRLVTSASRTRKIRNWFGLNLRQITENEDRSIRLSDTAQIQTVGC